MGSRNQRRAGSRRRSWSMRPVPGATRSRNGRESPRLGLVGQAAHRRATASRPERACATCRSSPTSTRASISRARATTACGSARSTKPLVEPCDAAPEEIDVAIAIDRFEKAVDWPVEAVERKWAGLRTFAPDRGMKFGFDPEAEGFFWCVGQGGMGIQTAPAASLLCAALIRGEPLPAQLAGISAADFAPRSIRSLAPGLGLGAGERVGALIFRMAGMALDPMPFDPVRLAGIEQCLPQLGILDRLSVGRLPAIAAPAVDPFGDPVADIDCCRCRAGRGRASSAPSAPRSRPSVPCGCWWSALRRRTARAPCHWRAGSRPSRPAPDCPCTRRR